jgi:hypothetical protein
MSSGVGARLSSIFSPIYYTIALVLSLSLKYTPDWLVFLIPTFIIERITDWDVVDVLMPNDNVYDDGYDDDIMSDDDYDNNYDPHIVNNKNKQRVNPNTHNKNRKGKGTGTKTGMPKLVEIKKSAGKERRKGGGNKTRGEGEGNNNDDDNDNDSDNDIDNDNDNDNNTTTNTSSSPASLPPSYVPANNNRYEWDDTFGVLPKSLLERWKEEEVERKGTILRKRTNKEQIPGVRRRGKVKI